MCTISRLWFAKKWKTKHHKLTRPHYWMKSEMHLIIRHTEDKSPLQITFCESCRCKRNMQLYTSSNNPEFGLRCESRLSLVNTAFRPWSSYDTFNMTISESDANPSALLTSGELTASDWHIHTLSSCNSYIHVQLLSTNALSLSHTLSEVHSL